MKEVLEALIKAAEVFMIETVEEQDRTKAQGCTLNPCPFCTAAVDLQTAILDAQDALEA